MAWWSEMPSSTALPPHWCFLFHIHHILIYPPPHKQKWCRIKEGMYPDPIAIGLSESIKEWSPISLLLVKLAGIPHIKAIIRSSNLLNEQSPVPLPHINLAKKMTVQPSTMRPVSAGQSHWFGLFYASAFCWSLQFGWLNSVVCYRSARKSWWLSTAMEMELWQSKGGPSCGKSRGKGCSFNAGGWSRMLNLWLIGKGAWCGIEGKRSCTRLLSSNNDPLL